MSYTINEITLLGGIATDADIKTSKSGTEYCRFSLATTYSKKKADGSWENITEWHNLICFSKQGLKILKNVKKGNQLLCKGKISPSVKEDGYGDKQYEVSLIINEVYLPNIKKEKQDITKVEFVEEIEEVEEDDIPF